MKKYILASATFFMAFGLCLGQGAIDGYNLSQPDMKGTARFMGMAGAFGALGGDLSTLSQNPAGIGVYRSGDVGFTLDLDCQKNSASAQGSVNDMTQTKFLLNNIGAVVTMRLPSKVMPNINFGFTYNKGASFNRKYGGRIPTLFNSLSNYIAGISNSEGLTEGDVSYDTNYDPYNPGYNDYVSPWLSILGYDGYLITPTQGNGFTRWYGQWGEATSGSGAFRVNERGSVDEYNIAIGGNIADVVYWGMNFDITGINYSMDAVWAENLNDAYVPGNNNVIVRESARWDLNNVYNASGTGFKYSLGVIVKPIQELRLGVAFHTPTWYNITENYGASIDYLYGGTISGYAETNDGILGYNNVSFRTPMKLMASVAGVIGQNFILSFDYEWTPYDKMKYSLPNSYAGGYDYPWYDSPWDYYAAAPKKVSSYETGIFDNDPFGSTNRAIKTYYKSTNTFRVGAEFKITPSFSVRAGYSYVSSPVKDAAKDDLITISTAGTIPNYRFDNETNYITCGLGYRYQRFYIDLAYVYKNMASTYHAYTPDPKDPYNPSPESKLSFVNNQVILSAGFRF